MKMILGTTDRVIRAILSQLYNQNKKSFFDMKAEAAMLL
jgi:hypothetical protein